MTTAWRKLRRGMSSSQKRPVYSGSKRPSSSKNRRETMGWRRSVGRGSGRGSMSATRTAKAKRPGLSVPTIPSRVESHPIGGVIVGDHEQELPARSLSCCVPVPDGGDRSGKRGIDDAVEAIGRLDGDLIVGVESEDVLDPSRVARALEPLSADFECRFACTVRFVEKRDCPRHAHATESADASSALRPALAGSIPLSEAPAPPLCRAARRRSQSHAERC